MIDVFIGYDEGEKIAYHILAESIRRNSSQPVSITPLCLSNIPQFTRNKQENQSTDFAFSRFMVPTLRNYSGYSIFMDCDMMFRGDIAELWSKRNMIYSVMCCKHDYEPKQGVKFRGAKNEKFEKKNWSSMMIFNNSLCSKLTPNFVNTATGLELHQFKWLNNEDAIGSLPLEWNWLVGEYDFNPDAKNVHWTLGGPYFKDYADSDYANEWFKLYADTVRIDL
jgi:lipopolysaccharide biosynthesis glycosyltransferase